VARYKSSIESAAAVAAATTFANLVAGASGNLKLRRLVIGVRAGAGVPTSQQLTVAIRRATARGTATTTVAPERMDPRSVAAVSPGVDTTWSTNPTLAATTIFQTSFNSQSGVDLPWESVEELIADQGNANGLALVNVGNALPASHLYTATFEFEE